MNILLLSIIFVLVLVIVFLICFALIKINNSKKKFENNLKLIVNTINSVRYGNLAARLMVNEGDKFPLLTESINRMVETIQDREKMIQEFKKEIMSHNVFLETLINSLSEGFLILDKNFNIKKMTSVSIKLLGENAENKNINDFFENFEQLNLSESNEITLKNNSNMTVLAKLSELEFAENKNFKYLLTIKDISKEKELNDVKNNFMATLAHDLRVPLLAESNTLKLLKNKNFGEVNPKILEVFDLLIQSNSDVLSLTEILLETYKLEQTKLVLNKTNTNINQLVQDVCDEMVGVLISNSMKINFECNEEVFLNIDAFQIKRVLRNLIKNSIDYSSEVSKNIEILINNQQIGCYITIRDFGYGISNQEQDLIFQKFYSGKHKFRKVGSGLGLYLSNEIVKAHEGTISIESVENKQTDFIVFLPNL
ncbi:hypothetical protein J6Q66_00220 [bacterium]|nr:hypothetical protein [bacterium]